MSGIKILKARKKNHEEFQIKFQCTFSFIMHRSSGFQNAD
jgi:hypothetical protein